MSPEGSTAAAVEYEIREIEPHEFERLGSITIDAYETARDELGPDYRAELEDVRARAESCVVLVAVTRDGTILGGVTYVPGPGTALSEIARDGEAEFRMLAVDPAAQGRGVGRALTAACVERARDDGRAGLAIYTRPWNVTAQRMYRSFGFVRDPSRDWEFEPGQWLWAHALAV